MAYPAAPATRGKRGPRAQLGRDLGTPGILHPPLAGTGCPPRPWRSQDGRAVGPAAAHSPRGTRGSPATAQGTLRPSPGHRGCPQRSCKGATATGAGPLQTAGRLLQGKPAPSAFGGAEQRGGNTLGTRGTRHLETELTPFCTGSAKQPWGEERCLVPTPPCPRAGGASGDMRHSQMHTWRVTRYL